MNFLKKAIAACALAFGMMVGHAVAQQPQTQAAPIFATNAKYANGVAPGYAPCGVVNGLASSNCPSTTGLNIQIGPGTANCPAGTITTYAGGSFTLSASTTTYIYLNTSAACAVSTKTTPFLSTDIPIATVVTGSSGITSIGDVRTFFSTGGGQLFSNQINPPISGQFVAVYASTFTFAASDAGSSGTVSMNSGYSSSGGGPIGAPHTGTLTWSNWTLPSFVLPGNVTAIYAVTINSIQGTDATPTFTCSPTGSQVINNFGGQQQITAQLSPTITGSNIGTVSCSAATAHSLSNGGYNAINVPYIALLVYYTGSAPPTVSSINAVPPLYYNSSNGNLGLNLPLDAGFDVGVANAYVVNLPGYAGPITGIGSTPRQQVGTTIRFLATHASTSTTPTLNFNSGGNVTIVSPSGGALVSGDISTSQVAVVVLEPSGNWALQNPQVSGVAPVTSVSNSDGTLTCSPTTGNVVCSIALAHANSWSAKQTQPKPLFSDAAGGGNQCLYVDNTGQVQTNAAACGLVASVSNSDGTITVTPTTGAVVASLNLAHANTWTAKQNQPKPLFTDATGGGNQCLFVDNTGQVQVLGSACGSASSSSNVVINGGSTIASLNMNGLIPTVCSDTSGSGSAQVCTTATSFTPQAGNCIAYNTTTANSGASLTINVNSLGAKSVSKWLGTTTLVAGDLPANKTVPICYDGTNWNLITIGNAPAGGDTITSPNATVSVGGTSTATTLDVAPVNTVVDTSTPVTVSTSKPAEFHYNENATAATAVTYNLPTAAAGKQFCFANANNGSAANTGVLTIATSASGQFIIFTDGTLSATGGNITSAGAAADSACLVGVDSTHWFLYVQSGTWTKH